MQRVSARSLPLQRAFPDKLFYKIGEVSKIADVEPYVLRYWESEFPFLRPRKSKSGQRVYIRKDLELIFQIKDLLYQDRYTIEGVRKKLGDNTPGKRPQSSDKPNKVLSADKAIEHIKFRLREILNLL